MRGLNVVTTVFSLLLAAVNAASAQIANPGRHSDLPRTAICVTLCVDYHRWPLIFLLIRL